MVASESEEGRERAERERNSLQGRRVDMMDCAASFKLESVSAEDDIFSSFQFECETEHCRHSMSMLNNATNMKFPFSALS